VDALRGVATYKTENADYAVLENEKTLYRKLRFVTDQRLAGVFVWRLEYDNFNGPCGAGKEARFQFTSFVAKQLVELHCNEQPWRCRLEGDAHDDDEEEEYEPNEDDDVDDSGE